MTDTAATPKKRTVVFLEGCLQERNDFISTHPLSILFLIAHFYNQDNVKNLSRFRQIKEGTTTLM